MPTNRKGLLYFGQGYSDIFHSIGLIKYYTDKYTDLTILMRLESKPLVEFFLNGKNPINVIYLHIGNVYDFDNANDINLPNYLLNNYNINIIDNSYDILFHSHHDRYRTDCYKNAFFKNIDWHYILPNNEFYAKAFYSCYNIDPILRISNFIINRNNTLEESVYNDFTIKYGTSYALYHMSQDKFNIIKNNDYNYIDLENKSDGFFDYIKVLENAQEFHLCESSWGAFIYYLDAKYELFKNKKIIVYSCRGLSQYFTEPLLSNWKIRYMPYFR
jgi:hypothetical protein